MASVPVVFIVDDDAAVRTSLERLVRSVGLRGETFASAPEFLQRAAADGPSCLVYARAEWAGPAGEAGGGRAAHPHHLHHWTRRHSRARARKDDAELEARPQAAAQGAGR